MLKGHGMDDVMKFEIAIALRGEVRRPRDYLGFKTRICRGIGEMFYPIFIDILIHFKGMENGSRMALNKK